MSSNPFAVASNAAPAAPAATIVPVETTEEDSLDAANESIEAAAGVTGEKKARKKSDKPRKERNRTINDEDKRHVLSHYCTAATGDIAKELGLTRAQVYNVVRNTRTELEKQLENPAVTPEVKSRIELALSKLPRKEFNGGASGGSRKSQSVDDILAAFGI